MAQAGRIKSDVRHTSYQLFADASGNHARLFANDFETETTRYLHGTKYRLLFRYTNPSGDIAWGNVNGFNSSKSSFAGRIIPFREKLSSQVEAFIFSNNVSTSLQISASESSKPDITAGIDFSPNRSLHFQISRSSRFIWPRLAEVYYQYPDNGTPAREGGELKLDTPLWSTRIAIALHPLSQLQITTAFQDGRFIPDNEFASPYHRPVYDGSVDGIVNLGNISVAYALNATSVLSLSYFAGRAKNRLQLYYDGHKFGHFGEIDVSVYILQLSYRTLGRSISVRSGALDGSLAGSLEAWPFIDGLARFIGERRHIKGNGAVDMLNISAQQLLTHFSHFDVNAGFDYIQLLPELEYTSWRPVFIGIGVDDLQKNTLDVERVDLLQVSVSAAIRVDAFRLRGAVSQWIPVMISRRNDNNTAGGGAAGSTPTNASADETSTPWNGLTVSLRLTAIW